MEIRASQYTAMYMYICIYIIAACLQIAVDGGGEGGADVQVGRQSQLWSPPFAPSRSGHSPTVETFLFSSPATIYVSLVFKASCSESSFLSVTSHAALLTILKQHLRPSLKARAILHVGRPARRCILGSAKRLREGKSTTVPGAHSILSTLPRILPS